MKRVHLVPPLPVPNAVTANTLIWTLAIINLPQYHDYYD